MAVPMTSMFIGSATLFARSASANRNEMSRPSTPTEDTAASRDNARLQGVHKTVPHKVAHKVAGRHCGEAQLDNAQWECPVCFEPIGVVDVVSPYACSHLACYQCFRVHAQYATQRNLPGRGVIVSDVTCPLCRAPPRDEFVRCRYLRSRKCVTRNGIRYKFYFPFDDDD